MPATPTGSAVVGIFLAAFAFPAAAYTQDRELEEALARGDERALAQLPAKGYKNGAADFFKTIGLRVVPGTERAWCAERQRGVLKAGCYVEFLIQGEGFRSHTALGRPCGFIARWYKAPGAKTYTPTPGAVLSQAIAEGNEEHVFATVFESARRVECR